MFLRLFLNQNVFARFMTCMINHSNPSILKSLCYLALAIINFMIDFEAFVQKYSYKKCLSLERIERKFSFW